MYLGTAGQMLVKARLLERGWNVSSPQVDFGDDLFAIRDADMELERVQVKTSHSEERPYGYSAQFRVGASQLATPFQPPLTYVFVVRAGEAWGPMVVLPQVELRRLVVEEGMGSSTDDSHVFYVRYHLEEGELTKLLCSESKLTAHANDFSKWERVKHG